MAAATLLSVVRGLLFAQEAAVYLRAQRVLQALVAS